LSRNYRSEPGRNQGEAGFVLANFMAGELH
jgi:hypothetical protein